MKHLDAKAIRERLHAVTLAIDTLENCSDHPAHLRIAQAADRALQEIALLVTDDEIEEHGQNPTDGMQAKRRDIRTKTAA
ncbi:MAG TPA: hypothetical protein VNE83_08890 [Terriglobales bacterium]|nr:hypothetical protein [Terriglobales bacterium]